MRWILGLVLLSGCREVVAPIKVSLSITPSSLTRPCLIGKVAVYDDLGAEYRSGDTDCNEAVIELSPGRQFAGMELESQDVGAVSLYLSN